MMYQPYQSTWNNPYMQTQYPNYSPQFSQPFNGITKVNGPQSALQRQLPPNSTSEPMFDMNGKWFYVVSTDGTGSKTLEWFDYSTHEQQVQQVENNFVSRDEFNSLAEKVSKLMGVNNGADAAATANVAVQ